MAVEAGVFVHLLACSSANLHEPQVFRMRPEQCLRKLIRAYLVFQQLPSAAESHVHMSVPDRNMGQLDPSATSGSLGLVDGDRVFFDVKWPVAANGQEGALDFNIVASNALQAAAAPQEKQSSALATPKKPSPAAGYCIGSQEAPEQDACEDGEACDGWVELTPQELPPELADPSQSTRASEITARELVAQPAPTRRNRLKEIDVPRSNMRATRVGSGPAKGWHVMAWLKDMSGTLTSHHQTHRYSVQWRIESPTGRQCFSQFGNLAKKVSDSIYTHIYNGVRPEVMRRIRDRRAMLEGVRFSRPKHGRRPAAVTGRAKRAVAKADALALMPPPAMKRPRKEPVTPVKLTEPLALLATQNFGVSGPESDVDKTWACECKAHLRRHARCVFAGHVQPGLVHLRDRMLVGRGESNDVILESKLTPQMISRCHAEVLCDDGVYKVMDNRSTNGILVNGQQVCVVETLKNGDIITFGVPTLHPEFDYVFELRPGLQAAPDIEVPPLQEHGVYGVGATQQEAACANDARDKPEKPDLEGGAVAEKHVQLTSDAIMSDANGVVGEEVSALEQ